MMKKLVSLVVLVLVLALAACGKDVKTSSANDVVTLKVGASSVPHAEVLEYLADDLLADGVKLEIVTSDDGIQTNQLTADGELDFKPNC